MKEHTLFSNILFILKKSWAIDKSLVFITLCQIPLTILAPLFTAYLSKYVVELVSQEVSVAVYAGYVIALSGALLVIRLLNDYIASLMHWRSFGNRFKYIELFNQKIMEMDYERLENPDGQTKSQKALNVIMGDEAGTQQIFAQIVSIISNFGGLLTYSAILLSFSPVVVLVLFLMTLIIYVLGKANNNWVHKNKDNWVEADRKMNYVRRKLGEFESAKDVRLYGMSGWFHEMFEQYLKERLIWIKKEEWRGAGLDVVLAVMNLLRDVLAYVVLIYQAVYAGLSAADFVLYFSLIGQYAGQLNGIIASYHSLQMTSLNLNDLRDFLEMQDVFWHGEGVELPQEAPEIELRNVTFTYPNSDTPVIRNLNLLVKKGEKIALVGLNGAGKTTLVKLICGLYTPTSGEILVNGRNIMEYNIEEYYSLFSVVFQDILLMPASIAKNVALRKTAQIDRKKLYQVLKMADLYEKVMELKEKENTLLLKSIHDNATDFSGGEKQKLALARALYKDGPILILDEPTAALDPVAESKLYQKYNQLTEKATSVFISHRLSSTRFCDRILFLENGQIAEQGSHDALMKLGGKYAELFGVQSQYYKEA